MKKAKHILILFLAILAIFSFGACASSTSSVQDITGVKQLELKVNEATDAKLLEGVEVLLKDGSTKKPNLEKEQGFDAGVAGKYSITYSYEGIKKSTNVLIYGMPKIYFDGTEIVADQITITFGQANASYNFTKGVKVLDSFGNELDVVKAESSDNFNNEIGEYTVSYTAVDAVGNQLNKTVKYVVTVGDSPVVSGGSVTFDANGCAIPCDLKGRTGALLFDNGNLVNPENYSFDNENLILSVEYALENLGEHNFVIETDGGRTKFSATITDEGYPLFNIDGLMGSEFVYGGVNVNMPADQRENSNGYTYEYALENSKGEVCVSEIEEEVFVTSASDIVTTEYKNKLVLTTANGKGLTPETYILTVTATAENGKVSVRNFEFSVVDFTFAGGESSTLNKTNQEIDGVTADYRFEKADDSSAWAGRMSINSPAGGYEFITFNIYFDYSQAQENGKVNAQFRAVVDSSYDRIIKCVDKSTGTEINVDDMLINKWYSITVFAGSTTNNTYLYFNPYGETNPVGVKAYISDLKVTLADGINAVFKSALNSVVGYELDGETLITKVNYSTVAGLEGWVNVTPFADEVWAEYLKAQELGGKLFTFDVKFTGTAGFNGYVNNGANYISNANGDFLRDNTKYLTFYDANGISVGYTNLATDTWYKMVFDIDAIKDKFGKMSVCDIVGHVGSSLRFGANTAGQAIYAKNVEFVDNDMALMPKMNGGITVSKVNGETVTTINKSDDVKTTFSMAVAREYLKAQELGGMLMQFDVKFTGTATYNGFLNNMSTYMSNTIRGKNKYVRFYDENGREIAYGSLQTGVWYKWVFDIDAIKTDVGVQTILDGEYAGLSLRIYANNAGNTISIKNVEFVEKQELAFKSTVSGAVTSYFDQDGTLVTELNYNGGSVETTPFSDSVWADYIKAQTAGGMLMQFDVKFTGSATINGHINTVSGYMSNANGDWLRSNTKYLRFYNSDGEQVLYENLQVGVWYKMVFDIDAIKDKFGVMSTLTINGHDGSSLRFGANVSGETIAVKNVEFVEKA